MSRGGRSGQDIPWVRMKAADGSVVEYRAKDASMSPAELEQASKRKWTALTVTTGRHIDICRLIRRSTML